MPAVVELEETQSATGTALSVWLRERLVESQGLTGKALPARIICLGSEVSPSDAMALGEGTIDSWVRSTSLGLGDMEWVRNLSNLASAARLIIPNLRGMTPVEQSNLRQYYRGIYRKV
jgi:hypothetical protein